MKLTYGDSAAQKVSERIGAAVADITELKGIPADRRVGGMVALKLDDGSRWRFHSSSALTGDNVLVATPAAGSGRWLLIPGACRLLLPIGFATADAAVLLTVPTGARLAIRELFWNVTTSFTGGTSSAIGVSSNKASFTTKGDLLGGAAGNVLATLAAAATLIPGTVGAGFDTLAKRRVVWEATQTIRFDRITSAFDAGAGNVVIDANLLQNNGA